MKNVFTLFILICFSNATFASNSNSAEPIHVAVSGKGQPVLFIPGFTVPGEVWNPVVKELEKTYECHVVTLAGFGGKEPISFPWLPQINESLETYLIEQDLKNVTVVGHSLGGTVATWLASRENSRISQLVIVDALPATGALMFPDFNPDNLSYDSPYNKQQLEMSDENFEQMAVGMSMGMSLNKEAQQQIKAWMLQADRKTYVYGYTDYLKLDMRENLKMITIPVTIIAADQPYGAAMATQTYKKQYENLENYNLIMATDAAHFIMLDQPEWFMDRLKEVLSND